MKRYFAEIKYKGTAYSGWQKQPNDLSVQEVVTHWFCTLLKQKIEIVGCGRTDARVHASFYIFHFDALIQDINQFIFKVNKALPFDISVSNIYEVREDAHARFDARKRSYEYYLSLERNPFHDNLVYHYPFGDLNLDDLNTGAAILKDYNAFFPFCKANHDAKTYLCDLTESRWEINDQNCFVYHISSNRFLRGMVRLIVGMCINVARQKIIPENVREALNNQTTLEDSWSAPAKGLYLSEVKYPDRVYI